MVPKADLEKLYTTAIEAMANKEFDIAASLLKQILVQDENYKDASRLLAQIIQRKRRRWYNNPILFVILTCVALAVLGFILIPKLVGVLQNRNEQEQQISLSPSPIIIPTTALPTSSLTSTATSLPFHWARINDGQQFPREEITALVVDSKDPDVIYVGTRSAGIFKTINGGESWQPMNAGIGIGSVNSFLINPQNPKTLFALTDTGLYKTSNGAEGWKQIADSNTVAMDPNNGDHLFICRDGGIFESLDGGETWTNKNHNYDFRVLSVDWKDSNKLYALGDFSSSATDGFYSSSDGGATWTFLKEFSEWDALVTTVLPSGDTGILIDAMDDLGAHGLFLSADGGDTWTYKGRWCRIISVTAIPSTVFCNNGEEKFYRSVNGGETWFSIAFPTFIETSSLNTIAFSSDKKPTLYVAGKDGIIYRSTNLGTDFDRMAGNGLGSTIFTLSINPTDNNYFILTQINCFLAWPISACKSYVSTNAGVTWNLLPESFLEYYAWDANGTSIYGIKPSPGGIVYTLKVSKDTGKSWVQVLTIPGPEKNPSGNTQIAWLGASTVQSGILFIYRTEDVPALLRSTDGGVTWDQMNLQVGGNFSFKITGNRLWAANDNYLVYTDDNGNTFQNCAGQNYDTNLAFTLLYMQKPNLILWGNTKDGIVQSKTDCLAWTTLPSQPEGLVINTMASDPNNENIVYVGSNSGAFISLDMGKSWAKINDGLLGANIIYSIVVDSQGNAFASTPYGIFKLENK